MHSSPLLFKPLLPLAYVSRETVSDNNNNILVEKTHYKKKIKKMKTISSENMVRSSSDTNRRFTRTTIRLNRRNRRNNNFLFSFFSFVVLFRETNNCICVFCVVLFVRRTTLCTRRIATTCDQCKTGVFFFCSWDAYMRLSL